MPLGLATNGQVPSEVWCGAGHTKPAKPRSGRWRWEAAHTHAAQPSSSRGRHPSSTRRGPQTQVCHGALPGSSQGARRWRWDRNSLCLEGGLSTCPVNLPSRKWTRRAFAHTSEVKVQREPRGPDDAGCLESTEPSLWETLRRERPPLGHSHMARGLVSRHPLLGVSLSTFHGWVSSWKPRPPEARLGDPPWVCSESHTERTCPVPACGSQALLWLGMPTCAGVRRLGGLDTGLPRTDQNKLQQPQQV